MSETCTYCGEMGHSIQECPKWKRKEVATATQSSVTFEEMRRALDSMVGLIRGWYVPTIVESALYAAKTTMKDPTERRVFIQDFAAALNRQDLLGSEFVDEFSKHGYVYMEAASEHSSAFHVKYIDLTTGKTLEKDIEEREQYDLYKSQREGKISIIEIHKVR